jgi:hypothetical protein
VNASLQLTDIENRVLRAMVRAQAECGSGKSVVVLRYALLEANCWDDDMEDALCNSGFEHPTVAQYYGALRKLVLETPFADGAGDLRLPAGPRYTDCWITQRGIERLEGQAENG